MRTDGWVGGDWCVSISRFGRRGLMHVGVFEVVMSCEGQWTEQKMSLWCGKSSLKLRPQEFFH